MKKKKTGKSWRASSAVSLFFLCSVRVHHLPSTSMCSLTKNLHQASELGFYQVYINHRPYDYT